MYKPRFQYTTKMVKSLLSIERSKAIVEMLPLPIEFEKEMKEEAKFKSAHFSTRIEGNPLDYKEAQEAIRQCRDRKGADAQQEVRNYWNALTFMTKAKHRRISINENFIKRLHSIIEVRGSGRRTKESSYRGSMPPGMLFAVYDDKTKMPEYIPPEYSDVPRLMKEFVEWLNSIEAEELPVPIKAAIVAYQLLTIHPFEDGNGRTSRALATYILALGNYDLKGFYSMEEYYVMDLAGYYAKLQMGLPPLYYEGRNNPIDLAPWIEYFIDVMERAFLKVANLSRKRYEQQIDPRILKLEPREKTLLKMLLMKNSITPKELADEFNVASRTISDWAKIWLEKGLVEAASGKKRIREYKIGKKYADVTLNDLGYVE